MHDLLRVTGERLADRDDAAVVERAGDREVVVDDLGHRHADRRQEDALRRLAEPRVLLRRLADDDRRIDRVAPHRHRGEVEDRERLRRRVVAGVVAERALLGQLVLLDVALEDDLRVRRHVEGDRLRAHELDGLAAQEAGEHQLVDVLRQRRARRVRRAPDRCRARPRPRSSRRSRGSRRARPCGSASASRSRAGRASACGTCRRCACRCAGRA